MATLSQFAARLLALATRQADLYARNATLFHLKWALIEREAHDARFAFVRGDKAAFDALAAALATLVDTSPGPTTYRGVLGQREGFIFSVHLSDAARAEHAVLAAWRTARTARMSLIPFDAAAHGGGAGADAVADAVLECGLYAVTITSVRCGVSARRVKAVRAALAECPDWAGRPAHTVPHVPLDEVGASVAAEQRQWLVIDRAHLLGSAEWAAALRLSPHIVAVGCLAIPPPLPGLALADLHATRREYAAATAEATDARAIRAQLADVLAAKWGGNAVATWTTLDAYLASVPGPGPGPGADAACRFLLVQPPRDKETTVLMERTRRRHGATAVRTVSSASGLAEHADGAARLVLFEASMATWSLEEWVHAVVFGARPACIVAGTARPVAFYVAMVQAARHYARRLAHHYL